MPLLTNNTYRWYNAVSKTSGAPPVVAPWNFSSVPIVAGYVRWKNPSNVWLPKLLANYVNAPGVDGLIYWDNPVTYFAIVGRWELWWNFADPTGLIISDDDGPYIFDFVQNPG